MRTENKAMQVFLAKEGLLHGITAKYIREGSLRGTWRLCARTPARIAGRTGRLFETWTEQDASTLNRLGFSGFDGRPLHRFSGNGGGMWQVFVRGHNDLATQ